MLKREQAERIVGKKWGREIWIKNFDKYCGKILEFNPNSHFSFHFHLRKEETWYVMSGEFMLGSIDYTTTDKHFDRLIAGDVVHIKPGEAHILITKTGGKIFEISTTHYDEDSYRIETGDQIKMLY